MRKSLFNTMAAGLVLALCLSGGLAMAGENPKKIPQYLQKKVLTACQEAASRGLISPVTVVDREALLVLVNAPCERVRTVAIYTLGDIREPRAVEPLILALESPDPNLRRVAAHALGKIGRAEAVGPLAALVSDKKQPERVRCTAARALGHIEDMRAAQALRQAAQCCTGQVRLVASLSLRKRSMNLSANN